MLAHEWTSGLTELRRAIETEMAVLAYEARLERRTGAERSLFLHWMFTREMR